MFGFLKKEQPAEKIWNLVGYDLKRVMDRLIFNEKCRKTASDEYWYNDGVIKFQCVQRCNNLGITVYDATDL